MVDGKAIHLRLPGDQPFVAALPRGTYRCDARSVVILPVEAAAAVIKAREKME